MGHVLKLETDVILSCHVNLNQNYWQIKLKKIYDIYLRSVVSYTCSIWTTTASDEKRLNIFERDVLRKMYGPIYNSVTQVWERRTKEQSKQLYKKGSIVQFLRGSRLAWAGHVWRAENSVAKIVLENNINKKRPRGRQVKRDITDLRPEWTSDRNHAYNQEEWNKLVLTAKSLDGM